MERITEHVSKFIFFVFFFFFYIFFSKCEGTFEISVSEITRVNYIFLPMHERHDYDFFSSF